MNATFLPLSSVILLIERGISEPDGECLKGLGRQGVCRHVTPSCFKEPLEVKKGVLVPGCRAGYSADLLLMMSEPFN